MEIVWPVHPIFESVPHEREVGVVHLSEGVSVLDTTEDREMAFAGLDACERGSVSRHEHISKGCLLPSEHDLIVGSHADGVCRKRSGQVLRYISDSDEPCASPDDPAWGVAGVSDFKSRDAIVPISFKRDDVIDVNIRALNGLAGLQLLVPGPLLGQSDLGVVTRKLDGVARSADAILRGSRGYNTDTESKRSDEALKHRNDNQGPSERRHAVRSISDAVIRRVLALSAICFGALFFGGFLWGRDGNVNRRLGSGLICIPLVRVALTLLWLFGWI